MTAVAASGQKGMIEMLLATHTGMTTEEFTKSVVDWIATARRPRFKRPYTEVIYQPMVELLAYLRANVREWAYDRRSHIGRLDKALDDAKGRGWTVVDMKADWKKIFAFE